MRSIVSNGQANLLADRLILIQPEMAHLCRLAPIPLWYSRNPRMAIRLAADSSRTTHGAHEAVDACRYMAGLLIGALQNLSKEQLLSPHFEPLTGVWQNKPLAPKIAHIASGSFKQKPTTDPGNRLCRRES